MLVKDLPFFIISLKLMYFSICSTNTETFVRHYLRENHILDSLSLIETDAAHTGIKFSLPFFFDVDVRMIGIYSWSEKVMV